MAVVKRHGQTPKDARITCSILLQGTKLKMIPIFKNQKIAKPMQFEKHFIVPIQANFQAF
jgi:hypothetical protein